MKLINEVQYADMFLNEDRHYPKFLETFKSMVLMKLADEIEHHTKLNFYNFSAYIKVDCEYCDCIDFVVSLKPDEDIRDRTKYAASYYNKYNQLLYGKLYKPQIKLICPFDGKKTDFFKVDYCVSHELTHLYDDWMSLKNGKDSIIMHPKNTDSTVFAQNMINSDNPLYKGIGMFCYMSLKVEKQAFLSQTIQELKGLGCNDTNYRDKIKETTFYSNVNKSYIMICDSINTCNETILERINRWLFQNTPKANVPKYGKNDFDCKMYREKIKRWADNTYHQLMKHFGSIVSYYLDEKRNKLNENNCILVL